ncbi:hypothetical protein [Methylobacterium nonmethylotrophicum]|uniref:Uncharacterized protein n=1 Tax=Methylobacterium nonmethylotrophicum TaxID=1141884 RepID=A0A4Z0NPW2_9HYPH|nr:hypothetical protein [Methylobacterium nonmethylotrophicum]TGD98221.1 hypothetical protein EU555_16010 [Methylobacterium nonmethylotrophicum]
MAKQVDRDQQVQPTNRDAARDNRYVADWNRKSRKEIVRDAIADLGAALKEAKDKGRLSGG